MQTRFLLPHRLKYAGWIIAIPAFILMILNLHYNVNLPFLNYNKEGSHGLFDGHFLWTVNANNFTDEVGSVLLLTGLLMIAFSREKDEDERIGKIRLESLLWAVLVNSILILFAIIFIYEDLFLHVMSYNICTPLILFIARFRLVMYFERKKLNTGEL